MKKQKFKYDDKIDDRLMIDIYRFRYNVYMDELNYLKPDLNQLDINNIESDEYDQYSKHIVIRNESEIVAYARIIQDLGQGLLVLNKIGAADKFSKDKKVEISRLIVRSDYRYSKAINWLMNAIYLRLTEIDCTYVFADAFYDSNSYKILKMLGFKELGVSYHDNSYQLDVDSVVLYSKKQDIMNTWEQSFALTNNNTGV